MAFSIGNLDGVPQEIELRAGIVHVNGEVLPLKGYTFEEYCEAEAAIAAVEGDDAGSCALRDAARIRAVLKLFEKAVDDDTLNYLEHMLGILQYSVEVFLGNAEPDGAEELPFCPRRIDEDDHHHHHHHDHEHHHDHDGCCCHYEH